MANGQGDDFFINPESMGQELSQYQYPKYSRDWAPIIQLIQLRIQDAPIDEEIKKYLLKYIIPYVNLAGFTFIEKNQIIEFWQGYQTLWTKYRIFMNPSKDPELIFLKSWIEEILMLMLNKSVEGIQLREVFETKTTYDVRHKNVNLLERASKISSNIFGRGKSQTVTTTEETG